tara:strand:- start:341 stop:505 length:165 start_codon:yes stop_codon:yes gene_type:complete
MTAITTVSEAVENRLADIAATAPDIGVSQHMFWLIVRNAADNHIQQFKETDAST